MKGNRVDWVHGDEDYPFPRLKSGEYGKDKDGLWYVCTPNGMLGNISKHTIVEHPDGTITVSPSILVTEYDKESVVKRYHGFLRQGEWSEC